MTEYRADIDGLRLIAVLLVVGYHFEIEAVAGGFIGVDVFFVISGFLISAQIISQTEAGTFRFRDFYFRRIKRILPALLVVVLVTYLIGIFLLSPPLLERMSWSVISAVLSVSNFFFLSEAGYFDVDAQLKPLLHTWSLSVEEQFYFIWPFLISLLLSRSPKMLIIFLVVGFMTSLLLSEYFARWQENIAFYIMPLRAFEFLAGVAMVWILRLTSPPALMSEIAGWTGLIAILGAAFLLDSDDVFPGVNALSPLVGTCLILWSRGSFLNQNLLGNFVATGGGKISYSIYLVHWPLFVFLTYYFGRELELIEILGLAVVTLLLSAALYRYVETPFRRLRFGRHHLRPATVLAIVASISVLLCFLSYLSLYGFLRVKGNPSVELALVQINDARAESWQFAKGRQAPADMDFEDEGHRVLVVGDSHSKSMFNALYTNEVFSGEVQVRRFEFADQCFPLIAKLPDYRPADAREFNCVESLRALEASSQFVQADTVLVAAQWGTDGVTALPDFYRLVLSSQKRLVLVERTPQFPDIAEVLHRVGDIEASELRMNAERNGQPDRINTSLRAAAEDLNVTVIDLEAFVCAESSRICRIFDGTVPLYYDGHHWTLAGAKYFGAKMIEGGFLEQVVPSEIRNGSR